ncbi:Asp-tRNAAsn/Glu-tRNAGln amidotransferase A subunit and related amidases [Enterococcus faecalis]|nr:Asp-tRNAAsn/Glu-tRNAGln amidotransferase A subunit and related amidases [Enterococcus faecalis]
MARQKLKRPLERNDVELLTWALFQTGKNITSEETTAAWTDIALQAQAMDEFYQQYPILLTPTTAATAPSIDNPLLKPEHAAQMERIDQLSPAEQKQLIYDQWLTAFTYTPFTQQANLFGHPALSVPTYVSKEGLPLGIQFNSALNEDRTLLQLGALFENNHKINQPHVEEPEKDKEPDASGEPEKGKDPDASGEPDKDKEPDASGEADKDKDPNASGEPDKDKEPDASGEADKDKEPNASGEPDKDKEPDASGEPEKDKDSDASGKPDKDKETKTSEGPIEGKDQNQNPDKAGKTTSESSLDNSLNSSANQGTKSTESTHAFSNKSMIGKQEQLPKKVLPKAGAEVPSTFWIVLGGAFLVTSGTIYIRKTRK